MDIASTTASTAIAPDSPKEMKAAITRMLAQMDEMREQMKADDIAIARSHTEYLVLKAETQVLREETERILANLRSAF